MIDNVIALKALRSRLLGTVVATTGVTTLTATGNGYSRSVGSFITDGFTRGMEVTPSGFANNEVHVIKEVTASTITLLSPRPPQASGAGRELSVVPPTLVAWENIAEDGMDDKRWFMAEEYIPSPQFRIGVGPGAEFDERPQYVITVYGLPDFGVTALYKMADAILLRFPPLLAMTLVDSNVLRVRSGSGPGRTQIMHNDMLGKPFIQVTIPMWVRTQNSI